MNTIIWKQLSEMIPQVVWSADPDGQYDYINSHWYEFTGAAPGSADGLGWLDSVHQEDQQRVKTVWQNAILSKSNYECEFRVRNLDGNYYWFLSRGRPILQDRVIRWIGTCTDIHSQKQSQELLKDAVNKKDEFLAMLSHELRNPISVIMNGINVLDKFELPEDNFVKIRGMINRQTKHLMRLVDDLLDIGRITRGKIVLRRKIIDIREAINIGIDMTPLIGEKQQSLHLNLSEESIKVYADLTRLSQVIGNLLSNAAKYTASYGNIILTTSKEDGKAFISIKDDGIGISFDKLDYIFDLFAQVDHSLDRSQGGLGIGLTLSKSIMQMHGGNVKAYSKGLGQGSEFVISMPSTNENVVDIKGKKTYSPSHHTILVVDDLVDAVESMATLLRIHGHTVFTATNGPDALQMVHNVNPSLVFLDIGIPKMNGYEIAKGIRRIKGDNIIIIALTGYSGEEERRKALDAGFDYHLVKPVEPDDLIEVIKKS